MNPKKAGSGLLFLLVNTPPAAALQPSDVLRPPPSFQSRISCVSLAGPAMAAMLGLIFLQELFGAGTTWLVIQIARDIADENISASAFVWIVVTRPCPTRRARPAGSMPNGPGFFAPRPLHPAFLPAQPLPDGTPVRCRPAGTDRAFPDQRDVSAFVSI